MAFHLCVCAWGEERVGERERERDKEREREGLSVPLCSLEVVP